MEEGERIMGMEIRPVYAGESMAWLVTSTDNAPDVWTLNKVALIRSVRPVPCWKCGYKTIQTGLFLELAGRDGYRCRIVSWSGVDKAGLLSQAFRRLLDVNWGVRPKYSKSMGCEYLPASVPIAAPSKGIISCTATARVGEGRSVIPKTGRSSRRSHCRRSWATGRNRWIGRSAGSLLRWSHGESFSGNRSCCRATPGHGG